MKTIYVLDTSALIFDPLAYQQFPYSDIIIPIAAVRELDKLKSQPGEVGRNARVAIKHLRDLAKDGDLSKGLELPEHISLTIDSTYRDPRSPSYTGFGDPDYGDTHILLCAYDTHLKHTGDVVSLVSQDFNLQLTAMAHGMESCELSSNKHDTQELYTGVQTIIHEEAGMALQMKGFIDPTEYGLSLHPNECVLFEDAEHNGLALARKTAQNHLRLCKKVQPWGLSPRNKEQSFAIDLMMDRNIDLITLIGSAGTGKSLIALAAGLELVLNRREYDKLIVYRPVQAVGNDIGFMPGTYREKIEPWFQAIMDSFEVLFSNRTGDWKREMEMYERKGKIELQVISHIRGRSLPNALILVDEAQNISGEDMKTILTRAGEGSKLILTGDIHQIDNNRLDAANNGLTRVIDKFKDSEIAGHITFLRGERSRLATLAADLL